MNLSITGYPFDADSV